MAKAISLLRAYLDETLPREGGFIIASRGDAAPCSLFEITAYADIKAVVKTPGGLSFSADGNRTHILVEPPGGPGLPPDFMEEVLSCAPANVTMFTGKNRERIFVPLEPLSLTGSFTVPGAHGDNFAFLFFLTDDVYMAVKKFIADVLYNDCGLGRDDSLRASELAFDCIRKFSILKP